MKTTLFAACLPALCAALLAGCAANPPYAPAQGEKTASLQLLNMSKAAMCKDGKFYDVAHGGGSGAAVIPAGERITLGTFMSFAEYQVSYTCYPFLSFVPREGQKYILHNGIRSNRCFIEVVREDGTKPTGVSFEPSIGPRHCFKKSGE